MSIYNLRISKPIKRLVCACVMLVILLQGATALAYHPEEDGVSAKYVILMEAQSGAVLYEKAAEERAYPASTTKIMTCIIALEQGNLDDEVVVGNEVNRFSSKSSLMGLREGEKITLRDLVYGLMLVSGNDAAAVIAKHMGGSIEGFAALMNEKAQELNLSNTHFMNPHGVQNEEHYTTAADMAKLTAYAMKNSDFRAIVNKRVYERGPTNKNKNGYKLENTNMLVHTSEKAKSKNLNFEYSYAVGVKTGDTDYAKRCLVAAAEKNGIMLIAVQLYDLEDHARFTNAKKLFEWGFSTFTVEDASKLSLVTTVDVMVANSSFEADSNLTLRVDVQDQKITCSAKEWERIQNNVSSITATVLPIGEITAPVTEGDKLATVAYKFEGKTLFVADAYATKSVMAMTSTVSGNSPTALPMQIGEPKESSSGPWLFIILVLVLIILIAGIAIILRNRRLRRMRRKRGVRRGTYAYRGRWQ